MSARATLATLLAAALALPLAGCERDQSAGAGAVKKSDAKAWEGPAAGAIHRAEGFQAGDKAAWEAHLKARTERGQNEYARTAAVAKP